MKVGLITFHAAYNFGSVLQAYATQIAVREIAGNCEIINYRTDEQRKVYSVWIPYREGNILKTWIKNLMILPSIKQRRHRAAQYEQLFESIYSLSNECRTPQEVFAQWDKYDLIVSGSDQIWNKHANELHYVDWEFMEPYLLHGYNGKKISYASSTAMMSREELTRIVPDINSFSHVSAREQEAVNLLNNLCNIPVAKVIDPTLLFTCEDWIRMLQLKKQASEPYILYYALNRRKDIQNAKNVILRYARKRGLTVRFVAPLSVGIKDESDFKVLVDVSPIDFLNLILNAETVITDSYHGTVFSLNFQKDFYSINGRNKSDSRKTDLLHLLGQDDRSILRVDDLLEHTYDNINYHQVSSLLDTMRRDSRAYLTTALSNTEE